jgi:Mlc titration factor MtfA (ptsG expression regulator)
LLWERVVGSIEALDGLDTDALARLRSLVAQFLAEKEMYGAHGFDLTDDIRLCIALQACLPVLEVGLDVYSGFVGVVVYPGEFRVRREEVDEAGVQHEWDDELSGEASYGGPVVLSWEDVATAERGYNVVIHEFAHKLDMLSGDADGYPPAPVGMNPREWRTTLKSSYERFCAEVDAAEAAAPPEADTIDFDFDTYAAEHPAEFFAVMTEMFFTEPHHLRDRYPDLYDAFARFYKQDPSLRLPR